MKLIVDSGLQYRNVTAVKIRLYSIYHSSIVVPWL